MQVGYKPPSAYDLDLEVLPVSVLRRRVSSRYLHAFERIEFNLILYVTEGRCTHIVDFESVDCTPGSLLVLHPGQVHRFDSEPDWQGWLVLFRPEFLHPSGTRIFVDDLEGLPAHLVLNEYEQHAVSESISRMSQDAFLKADSNALHVVLRNQLITLLARIQLANVKRNPTTAGGSAHVKRFARYRRAVEKNLHSLHSVSEYAKLLGCSEKSLARAVHDSTGISAKEYLTQRLTLEAKRLLAHTTQSVSSVAYTLGFNEAANFIKFFKREAGSTPREFREKYCGNTVRAK